MSPKSIHLKIKREVTRSTLSIYGRQCPPALDELVLFEMAICEK
jgi:hypothetical protein